MPNTPPNENDVLRGAVRTVNGMFDDLDNQEYSRFYVQYFQRDAIKTLIANAENTLEQQSAMRGEGVE